MGSCICNCIFTGIDIRMKYCLGLFFVAVASASPYYYFHSIPVFPYVWLNDCGKVCVSPPCTCNPQPIVISLPGEDGAVDYDCEEAGSFPNRENACKSYYVCIEQPEFGNFSVTERTCNPTLAFDASLGVCNWESAVTDC